MVLFRSHFDRDGRVAVVAGLLVFGVYVTTACPTVHWLDGGELTAAAFHLVPAHAPGEPLFVLFGRLASLFPVGAIPFRVNLLSALSGAVAAALLATIVLGWLKQLVPGAPFRWYRVTLGTMALTGVFWSHPVWIQGVRAEVYSLHLALAAVGLATSWLAAGGDGLDLRWTAVSAFAWGADLAVHPLLAVLAFLPAAAMALARARRCQPRVWTVAFVSGVASWSIHGLLPIRAIRHPGFGWGDAGTFRGFLDMVLARSFQHNFSPATSHLVGHNLGVLGRLALEYVGPAGIVLATMGLGWLLFVKKQPQALLAVMVVGFALLSVVPQNKVYSDNPDLLGYMALPVAAIWTLAAAGTGAIVFALRSRVPLALGPAALLVGVLAAVLPSVGPSDRGADYQARDLGMAAFDQLAPGAVLVTSGNDTTFVAQYLQEVERFRPDVLLVPRSLVTHAWFRARLPYPDSVLRVALERGDRLVQAIGRPVRVELREQDLAGASHLCPAPAPGWGFYDVLPCDLGSGADALPPLDGLFFPGRAGTSRHALLLGLNAALYLCDYYRAAGHPDWARMLRSHIDAKVPGLVVSPR